MGSCCCTCACWAARPTMDEKQFGDTPDRPFIIDLQRPITVISGSMQSSENTTEMEMVDVSEKTLSGRSQQCACVSNDVSCLAYRMIIRTYLALCPRAAMYRLRQSA